MKTLALVALAGCTVGAGTSTVGIWRPKRVVDTEVCIQETPDRCTRTTEIARDLPARSFGGGLFSWFNPGYMHLDGTTRGADRVALDSHYEYLRGRAGFAVGVRLAANIAFGSDSLMFSYPITAVAHWGFERFSLYGGPGYTPYARDKYKSMTTESSGFHVLAGGRVLLRAGRHYQLTTSFDVFRQYLGDVTATSVTAAFCIHL